MTAPMKKTIIIKLKDKGMEDDELDRLMEDLEKFINHQLNELMAKTTRHFGLWVATEIEEEGID